MSSKEKTSRKVAADEHDEGALHEAERRMLLHDGADAETHTEDVKRNDTASASPNDEHDPEALEEASEKMLLRRDRR